MDQKPLIFISNDDGITSKGLHRLIDTVAEMGEVIAVAPLVQHSGQSSAITVSNPLRITKFPDYKGAKMLAVDGSPVDCVKLAMHTILPRRPDLMLSGINHGSNAGNCALYSGTMGAAMETCMAGIPSVAYSLLSHDPDADFDEALPFIADITRHVLKESLPTDVCLNVNIPARCKPLGVKVVRAALGYWTDEYEEYTDPHGRPFYMLSGKFVNSEPESTDTDEYWLARQYISVVPVRPDQSCLPAIPEVYRLLGLKD